MKHPCILTIGHSNHTLRNFVDLIKKHAINALVDVRSVPYSRSNPQFNKEVLQNELQKLGIWYVFLGRELGARSDDKSCYENGRVQYRRLAETKIFRDGIQRLIEGAAKYRIALMCAEREPLNCHRTLLVGRTLDEIGVTVEHIHADGRIESHQNAMIRLLSLFDCPHEDLFRSTAELIDDAITRQEARIAFIDQNLATERTEDSL